MKFDLHSIGETKYSLRAHYLSSWFAGPHSKMVNVPLQVTTELMIFDFQRELELVTAAKDKSSATLNAAAQLLSGVMSLDSEDDLVKLFSDKGFKGTNAQILDLISVARRSIADHVSKNTIAVSFVKDVLEREVIDDQFSSFKEITFDTLADAVALTQELYSSIVHNTDTATLSVSFANALEKNSAFRFIKKVRSVFQDSNSPSAEVRLSTVLNSISEVLYEQPMVSIKERVPGMMYDVTLADDFAELDFRDILAGFHTVLLTVIGARPTDTLSTITSDDLLKQILLGYSTPNLLLPGEATPDSLNRIKDAIVKHWMRSVIIKIATGSPSTTQSRFISMIDEKKYLRADEYAAIIQKGVDTVGMGFDCFLEAGHFFKNLATDRSLYQDDMHPILQEKYLAAVYEHIGSFAAFTTTPDRPNHLKDPALVVNARDTSGLFDQRLGVTTLIPKDVRAQQVHTIYDKGNKSITHYYTNEVVSGSFIDLPSPPAELELLPMAAKLYVDYAVVVPSPSILNTDYFSFSYKVFELSKLQKMAGKYFHELVDRGMLVIIEDKYEMASVFGLPLEIAARLMGGSTKSKTFLDLRGVSEVYYAWDFQEAPIYDFALVSDSRLIEPVVTHYPAYATRDLAVGLFAGLTATTINFNSVGAKVVKNVDLRIPQSKIDNSDLDPKAKDSNPPVDPAAPQE